MAHYGKVKPLRVLLERHGFDPNELDVFQQNLAIYASRQGQLDVIRYIHKKYPKQLSHPDSYSKFSADIAFINNRPLCFVFQHLYLKAPSFLDLDLNDLQN